MGNSNLVPDEWVETDLGSISSFIQYGLNAKSNSDSKGVFYLRITDIDNSGGVNPTDARYIAATTPDLGSYLLEPGDLVLARSGTVGISFVYQKSERPWAFASYLIRFRLKQEVIDPEYLSFYLRSSRYWRYINSIKRVAAQPNVNSKEFAALPVPLPPLSEQRRIVGILREADALRQLRQNVDEKIESLADSIFQKLFGGPADWQKPIRLADTVTFVGGGTPDRKMKSHFTGTIPWATSKDIKARYLSDTQEHITEEAVRQSATNLVPARTILMVVKSKILMHTLPLAITTRPFCFGQDIKGLICNEGFIPEFIVAALAVQSRQILSSARGVNTEGLTLEILRSIPLPNVDIDKQQDFLEQTKELNVMLALQKESSLKLDELFQSLLSRSFAGELTATWREVRARELAHEAAERDRVLQEARSKTRVVASLREFMPPVAPGRERLYSALSEKQRRIFALARERTGHFTPEQLHVAQGEDETLSSTDIQQTLRLLADAGLLRRVRVAAQPSGRDLITFVPAFRALREDDQAKRDDLRLLKSTEA